MTLTLYSSLSLSLSGSGPALPSDLKAEPINSTAVVISWATPTNPNDLYIVSWCGGNVVVLKGVNSMTITGLEPGQECVVMVTTNNECITREGVQLNVTTPTAGIYIDTHTVYHCLS